MIKKLRHTGIIVKNLEESLRFYQDLLGFKICRQMEEEGSFIDEILGLKNVLVTTVKMLIPDTEDMLELLYYHSQVSKKNIRKIDDIGIGHIAITVDDIDSLFLTLKNNNICFISSPVISSDGLAKVAFCKAPEGTFIELVQELI